MVRGLSVVGGNGVVISGVIILDGGGAPFSVGCSQWSDEVGRC